MAFNPFHYNETAFKKLPFLGKLFGYIYKDLKKETKSGFLYEVSITDYDKIKVILKGERIDNPIVAGDKVYVLPNCKIPNFKLKEYFKKTGAIQVNDIIKATKILGHENIEADNKHSISCLIKKYTKYFKGSRLQERRPIPIGRQQDLTAMIDFIENPARPMKLPEEVDCIVDIAFRDAVWRCGYDYDPLFLITPTCAEILYYKIASKIPIVDEQCVYEAIDKPLIIDNEIYDTLVTMFESGDPSNHTTAIEILSNCDAQRSLYYIWKLIKSYDNVMNNYRRIKNFRLLKGKIDYNNLYVTGPRRMLELLEERDLLTGEVLQKLIIEIVNSFEGIYKSSVFDIILTTSKRFHKYEGGEQVFFVPCTVKTVESELPSTAHSLPSID